MSAITEQSRRVADIFARPIGLIDPDPENCRDIDAPQARLDIEEIALSILKRGFDPDRALLVRKLPSGRWMVTDGHKRREAVLRAIELGAMIDAVPCRSEEKGTNEQDRAILRLRAPGRELSPLEAVIDIKRLLGWGWSDERIADQLGKKKSWVRDCLELSGAPADIREAVRNGNIAPTEARKAVRAHGPEASAVVARATKAAQARGKTRATGRDIAAVTKPRTEPLSLPTLAMAVVFAWDQSDNNAIREAIEALRASLGPLLTKVA